MRAAFATPLPVRYEGYITRKNDTIIPDHYADPFGERSPAMVRKHLQINFHDWSAPEFHADRKAQFDAFNLVKEEFRGAAPHPAWTAVGTSGLIRENGIAEVQMIAYAPIRAHDGSHPKMHIEPWWQIERDVIAPIPRDSGPRHELAERGCKRFCALMGGWIDRAATMKVNIVVYLHIC